MHVSAVLVEAAGLSAFGYRAFQVTRGLVGSYFDPRRLDVPCGTVPALRTWLEQDHSIAGLLAQQNLTNTAGRPQELVDDPTYAQWPLFGPIETFAAVTDCFAITIPLDGEAWIALVLLRCHPDPPFAAADLGVFGELKPAVANVLRAAYQQDLRRLKLGTTDLPPTSLGGMVSIDFAGPLCDLTRTERRVFDLLCTGATERTIAQSIHRSPHTVHVHVKSIYRKLGVRSRKELLQLSSG